MEEKKHYQVVCYVNYCGWRSEVTDDLEVAEKYAVCPRCGAKIGPKFRIEEVEV